MEKILDIENFEVEYDKLKELFNCINSNFQALVFDYANKMSGKIGESIIIKTRNDLQFRIESILYFVNLIRNEEISILEFLNKDNKSDGIEERRLVSGLVRNQKTIFDSILYHLSSIYDYYSMMPGELYFNKGLKWNSIHKAVNGSSRDKIGLSQIILIKKSHSDFVDSLFSHRSYLIHQSTSYPGYSYEKNYGTGLKTLKVFAPKKFINEFKELKSIVEGRKVTLRYSLFWILIFGLRNVNDLLYGLKDEIERLRKVKKGDEIITDVRFPDSDVSEQYWTKY